MIPLLALALAAVAPPPCAVRTPGGCGGMYELVTAPGFQEALRRFVGNGRADWYEPNADRTQQLFNILSGPSAEAIPVGGDLLRFDACFPHACNIRGALFITRAGEIRGAAMLFPDCGRRHCTGREGLRLAVLRDPRHPEVAELGRQWGEADVATTNERFPSAHDSIARVTVENVPPAVPARPAARRRR